MSLVLVRSRERRALSIMQLLALSGTRSSAALNGRKLLSVYDREADL